MEASFLFPNSSDGGYDNTVYDHYDSFYSHDHDDNENSPVWARLLQDYKKTAGVRIDYSVLSVGVMTLGLIMIVEVVRHRLDHAAHHRPFYKAVLEGVYEELATLGIVEFFLHILAEYHENYDKAKKQVFADVHFLLFYTAILNALQCVLLQYVTGRISNKIWVETEDLELHHYVEIREEFDRVKLELDKVHQRKKGKTKSSLNNTDSDDDDGGATPDSSQQFDETAEDAFHLNQDCLSTLIQSVSDRIYYPVLKKKYNSLLLQVRFHELRVHFLQAYDLPLKFKISDYLVRSEQAVLIKLIHVSSLAWLLLTGVVNLLYYILGIVSYKVADAKLVGVGMVYLFFLAISMFVVLSWLVSNKMKAVFKAIMNSATLWDVHQNDPSERERLAAEQKALFWGADPKLVIASIQFMQFGYAVAISTVIIFWEEMNDGNMAMAYYLLAIFLCYCGFVSIVGYVIPRYTLCTSLAQLVNQQRLHETVASFRLEEAKQKEVEELKYKEQQVGFFNEDMSLSSTQSGLKSSRQIEGSFSGSRTMKMDSSVDGSSVFSEVPSEISNRDHSAAIMMELVKLDTESLRTNLPQADKKRLDNPKQKNRLKQFSDGVSSMNLMKGPSNTVCDDFDLSSRSRMSSSRDQADARADRISRRKTRSEGVAYMAGKSVPPEFLSATDRSRNTIVEPSPKEEEDDNVSLASESSGHSDINDLPKLSLVKLESSEDEPKTSYRERLQNYFISRKFIVVSNVFGTMIVFFFIGQRVESFLHSEGIADDRFTHFDFAHDYLFWLLTFWLVMFIFKSYLIFYSFWPLRQLDTYKEQQIVLAAVFDIVLSHACIVLLFVAEAQRCCSDATKGTPGVPDTYGNITPAPCSCPRFGSRQYGGLGQIEPYISLIALRLFRHWVAKRMVNIQHVFFGRANSNRPNLEAGISLRLNPFEVFAAVDNKKVEEKSTKAHAHSESHKDQGHDDHHGAETGTAAELWETAIGRYPEIADEYGEFSAELLRAMLGLQVETTVAKAQESKNTKSLTKKKSFTLDRQFSTLEPAAQEVIMAGKLGRSVVRSKQLSSNSVEFKDISTKSRPTKNKKVVFEVDENSPTNSDSLFVAPNARLVRSMRRCDRKLLPMIDKWTVVDVAITHFEMVYFDASCVDEAVLDKSAEGSRQALIATKGGKNLRLCDVAIGRRIVGHEQLSDISSMYVERLVACDPPITELPNVEVSKNEFWTHSAGRLFSNGKKRGEVWGTIKQDVLTIHSHGHTLHLRFYGDLDDAEHHPSRLAEEDETSGFLFKNNALQWVQTIGRLCGSDQLHQQLPHLGEGNAEELRDFLVVRNRLEQLASGPRRLSSIFRKNESALDDRVEV